MNTTVKKCVRKIEREKKGQEKIKKRKSYDMETEVKLSNDVY